MPISSVKHPLRKNDSLAAIAEEPNRRFRLRSGSFVEKQTEEEFRVIGSLLYEDPISGEVSLTFYSSTLDLNDEKAKSNLDYPQ